MVDIRKGREWRALYSLIDDVSHFGNKNKGMNNIEIVAMLFTVHQ